MRLALVFCLCATPTVADVSAALSKHIQPRYEELALSTAALSSAAAADCAPETVQPAFHHAYDAWISISHILFGPIEDNGLSLAFSFWPDTKDSTGKALARLTTQQDPIVDDNEAFGDVSVAAQGFTALERMIYEQQPDIAYACRLTRAIATGLARNADQLATAWPEFATSMETAGAKGNRRFQTSLEAQRVTYTALSAGLEFLHDLRLGRPLGTFERPRPRRAEAWRSERSMRNIVLSLAALEDLALHFSESETPQTRAAFAQAQKRADTIDDPALAGVAEPVSRLRIEALQQNVRAIQIAVTEEIGEPLGITAGFNSLDGD